MKRFEKRIYIPLPDINARAKMFQLNVGNTKCSLQPHNFRELAEKTDGYSGSDIAVVVRDALMEPVRKVQLATHFKQVTGGKWMPCSPGEPGAIEKLWTELEGTDLEEPPLTDVDFKRAVSTSRPSVNQADIDQYTTWTVCIALLSVGPIQRLIVDLLAGGVWSGGIVSLLIRAC